MLFSRCGDMAPYGHVATVPLAVGRKFGVTNKIEDRRREYATTPFVSDELCACCAGWDVRLALTPLVSLTVYPPLP